MDQEEKVVAYFKMSQMFLEVLKKTKDPFPGEVILGQDLNCASLTAYQAHNHCVKEENSKKTVLQLIG
jgi:hypothetical protein